MSKAPIFILAATAIGLGIFFATRKDDERLPKEGKLTSDLDTERKRTFLIEVSGAALIPSHAEAFKKMTMDEIQDYFTFFQEVKAEHEIQPSLKARIAQIAKKYNMGSGKSEEEVEIANKRKKIIEAVNKNESKDFTPTASKFSNEEVRDVYDFMFLHMPKAKIAREKFHREYTYPAGFKERITAISTKYNIFT